MWQRQDDAALIIQMHWSNRATGREGRTARARCRQRLRTRRNEHLQSSLPQKPVLDAFGEQPQQKRLKVELPTPPSAAPSMAPSMAPSTALSRALEPRPSPLREALHSITENLGTLVKDSPFFASRWEEIRVESANTIKFAWRRGRRARAKRAATPSWATLIEHLQSGLTEGEHAAAKHAGAARAEAAYKLLSNHERVLLDLTNPSTDLNIDGKPLTQALKLKRIASQHTAHADGFLRELTRRLLGKREASLFVELRGKLQAAAWIAASKYLNERIQSTPEQKQGRTPDMSPAAAAAAMAVMADMCNAAAKLEPPPNW